MQITSGILDKPTIELELQEIPRLLADAGNSEIEAMFGWGCDAPSEELYHPFTLQPGDISGFLGSEGVRVGFEVSRSDLFLEVPQERLMVQFCHESDIHIEGRDESLVSMIERRWRSKGFPGNARVGNEWIPFAE